MKQSKGKLNQITEYINEIMNNQQVVGLSVAIWLNVKKKIASGVGNSITFELF